MKLTLSLAVLLILLFIFVRFIEKKSLYFPLKKIEATPEAIGLDYEEVHVETEDDIEISGWFIPSASPRATVLFSHGNGGNISHRLEKIMMLNSLGLDVLIFDYRGYGTSEGNPHEKGLYRDAESVYDFLIKKKKVPAWNIIGYGESLGGAVIIDLAQKHELEGIIVEGTFSSIRDMAGKFFPFIPSFVYQSKYNSFVKIEDIHCPKLIMHSAGDEIVPFEQGKKLYDNAPEPKKFVTLHGGHNDSFLVSRDLYMSEIDAFISSIQE